MTAILQTTYLNAFIEENVIVIVQISPKFFPRGSIENKSSLVQVIAWSGPGNKPLPEPIGDHEHQRHEASAGHTELLSIEDREMFVWFLCIPDLEIWITSVAFSLN